jgi:hypothetical protein
MRPGISETPTYREMSTWKWSRQFGDLSENTKRLHQHVNVAAIRLLENSALVRRLKRTKAFELV